MADAAAIMEAAGSRFSDLELIGRGSFGDVYKGNVGLSVSAGMLVVTILLIPYTLRLFIATVMLTVSSQVAQMAYGLKLLVRFWCGPLSSSQREVYSNL
nr:germinal center kinase 1-like [Tanacetum cinerariifolium]